MIYLVYPILIAVLVIGMKISPKGHWNEEFMTLEQTKYLQGFTALLIMFHHLGQKTCAPWHNEDVIVHGLDIFVNYGFYFVGIFLFCIGYGLYKSYITKDNYLDGFFRKRILPVIVVFYTAEIIFLVARLLLGQKMGVFELILNIVGFKFSNTNAWFLVAAPMFYAMFYYCFKYCKAEKKAVMATCICIMVYIIFGTLIKHNQYWFRGEWWYQSAPFFAFGLLFAANEEKAVTHIKKHYKAYLIGSFVLIAIFRFVSSIFSGVFSYYYGEYSKVPVPLFSMVWRKWVTLLSDTLASSAFVFFVFISMLKVKIGNRFLGFMGTITLQFYVIHGLFVELFGYDFFEDVRSLYYVKNPAIHTMITFVCAIPSAVLFKKWTDFCCGRRKVLK